ncbi:MAG: DUF928 domain-containing protein [Microcoleus sp. PH2017_25_DOB_D_A]|jgi:hypothetical protein|uniref:DUF928 domain-containing protein n=1 Tax=unclassified Microcoleus TaxID=2642155 RepID=UPI001D1C5F4B|nr:MULTISPECIES: DUF928 domain-containing protein [unclassified Microcoleus]TAE08708.1 MAG: DUF928 domain-containing protein [Oscillatoriales cyanobacterium]MCC3537040.1 DUF928 domain-containing protein [Microcoleus sp. PH2017_25_DOB_D_A]MCC3549350.1 DUF928 domain-containing protein [Microcoleus sp. PH2017_24_DOB_U_A]MCC3565793.1 DUF928 domain-containing protein [Microcoleus sp. PH2017_31_RDM_U_A]MCC3578537.1 DUF928 domain-containing protein [Microcoleus sp. PH2017_32_RDM_D_A]
MKRFLHFTALAIAVCAIALSVPSFLPPMQAVPAPMLLSQNVKFKPPDVDAPDNRQSATHRGNACPQDLSIVPLIPKSNDGLTLAESPTFLAYVSHPSTQVEFTLQADDGKGIDAYKTTFKVDKPGIIEVSIPNKGEGKKTLEVNQRYQWSFSVACNDDPSGNYFVKGFVKRIEPEETLKKNLANPDPMARAIAYAENNIWYDTIGTLAQMRRGSPNDASLRAEWKQLLQSQKLESVADQPLGQSF